MCDNNQAIIIKLVFLKIFKMYQSNPNNQVLIQQEIVVNGQTSGDNSAEIMKILLFKEKEKGIKSCLRWLIFLELVCIILLY